MASPRSVTSPWSTFKRLKICRIQQPSNTILPNVHRFPTIKSCEASISTSAIRSQADPLEDSSSPVQESSSLAIDSSNERPARPRAKVLRPQDGIRNDLIDLAVARNIPLPPQLETPSESLRLPRSVQSLYLRPLRRTPTHGIPVANLQLRSFSVRNLEFVADFAMRAAYYLNLPAKGPIPLPRITERWTVPRSSFIFKKSQENFERVTVRRLVQVLDGHPEVVQRWLAFVRKWSWYGVGLKADVFEYEGVDVVKRMDDTGDAFASGIEGVKWEFFGRRKGLNDEDSVSEQLRKQGFETEKPATPGS